MIIYFATRTMTILGMASTELPGGGTVLNDVKKADLSTGTTTFECEVAFTSSDRSKVEEMTTAGNYVLRYDRGECEYYAIIETEEDTEKGTVYIYAEDAGLDLLNEVLPAYSATVAHPADWYILKFSNDSGFEIGINEISDRTRKLSWDSDDMTAAERIRSVATQFDAEIGYRFDIDKLTIRHKYIDIYEKRGTDTEAELRLGRDVKKITKKTSIADLCTCLRVRGGTPEGKDDPITLKGYKYDDGDIWIDQTYGDLKTRDANAVWSRYLSETGTKDGYIVGSYSYDTTSQKELLAHAITELKKRCQPVITYDVELYDLPESIRLGDTVRLIDEEGKLYMTARVLETEERVTDGRYGATFGDFTPQESGISAQVASLAEKYAALSKQKTYTWTAYADDASGTGISLDSSVKSYVGYATNRTSAEADISDPTLYSWSAIEGMTAEQEATLNSAASTAEAAKTAAAAAQTTAETAQSAASTAQTTAEAAQTSADGAAKTATDYIGEAATQSSFTVGKTAEGHISVDTDSVDVMQGDETVLKFGLNSDGYPEVNSSREISIYGEDVYIQSSNVQETMTESRLSLNVHSGESFYSTIITAEPGSLDITAQSVSLENAGKIKFGNTEFRELFRVGDLIMSPYDDTPVNRYGGTWEKVDALSYPETYTISDEEIRTTGWSSSSNGNDISFTVPCPKAHMYSSASVSMVTLFRLFYGELRYGWGGTDTNMLGTDAFTAVIQGDALALRCRSTASAWYDTAGSGKKLTKNVPVGIYGHLKIVLSGGPGIAVWKRTA